MIVELQKAQKNSQKSDKFPSKIDLKAISKKHLIVDRFSVENDPQNGPPNRPKIDGNIGPGDAEIDPEHF